MKKLLDESKKQVLDKLKWFSSILDVLANIFKSFAMIISSIVAGTTAGITGYYEIKKAVKKEHHVSKSNVERTATPDTLTNIEVSSTPETVGYDFDMNSGVFIVSIIMLTILIINKMRKPTQP